MIKIDSKGTILSYTTLQMPPDGFSSPLTMALVELERGVRILCLGNEEETFEPVIGAAIEISLDREERFHFHLLP